MSIVVQMLDKMIAAAEAVDSKLHASLEYLKELREHGMLMHHHGATESGADWIHDHLWHQICDLALASLLRAAVPEGREQGLNDAERFRFIADGPMALHFLVFLTDECNGEMDDMSIRDIIDRERGPQAQSRSEE